jgi:MFS family permease
MKSARLGPDNTNGLKLIFRALSHRNYRLFFGGQGISLIGTWMQQIAMNWLVYRLTQSALLLGVVGFASRIPTFLLASLAGVLADRWNRHRVLVLTQTLSMIQAMILAILVLTETIAVWQIISLSLARLGGFDGYFNQNPCNFEPRVRKVFTTGAVLIPGPQPSHGAAADRVMITATALATFGVPARAGCTAT